MSRSSFDPHLLFSEIERFVNWLMAKKWRFYLVGEKYNFFTSDTPVIEVFPKQIGIYGLHIAQRTHYFPLTPKILIELSDPNGPGKRARRKTLHNFKDVLNYNLLRIRHSDEFIYSPESESFDYILANYRRKQLEY